MSSESNHRTILKYLILLLSRNPATCPSQPFFAFKSHTILIETQIQLILSPQPRRQIIPKFSYVTLWLMLRRLDGRALHFSRKLNFFEGWIPLFRAYQWPRFDNVKRQQFWVVMLKPIESFQCWSSISNNLQYLMMQSVERIVKSCYTEKHI